MYPILFSIGNIRIYNHGLLMVIGAVVGATLIYLLAKKQQYDANLIFDLLTYSFLGGLVGARLVYVLIYFHQFSSFREIFFIWSGGLVSYGGMIGGLLTAYFILKKKGENLYLWFDIGVIGMLVGWGIGRIGCLLNGDSFGISSNAKIAIWGRIPTQLFETIWTILVAIGLYFVLKNRKRFSFSEGMVFWLGIATYSLGRFIIDFWREETIFLINLKLGQIGSLIIFIICLLMMYRLVKNLKELVWS